MSRHTVLGVLFGTAVACSLCQAEEGKRKKARSVERGSPVEALRAMAAFHAAPMVSDRSERLTQTMETPFTTAYKVIHVEFRDADACRRFNAAGAHVFNRFDRFADLFVDINKDLTEVLFKDADHGIAWFDFATRAIAPPPRPTVKDQERVRGLEDVVRNGVGDVNGAGTIVAVIDTGIDFRHPDFVSYDTDGKPTSRLLYYWDTTSDAYAENIGSKAPLSYPNGASIGTVFSGDDLTRELRASSPHIHVWDIDGHGTACASIAAGNGNALSDHRYAGVAPRADLIAVRIQDRGPGLENFYLLNSICGWLDKVARKESKPVVISCSFGGHVGGHDGYRVDERQLNARYPSSAQGRALCIAAGNEGYRRIHAAVSFGPTDKGTLQWVSFQGGLLDIYTDATAKSDVELEGAQAKDAVQFIHGLTRKLVIFVRVPSGQGQLKLASKTGKTLHADAYITTSSRDGFDDTCRVPGKQVGTPATAAQAITVGSYDFDNQFDLQGKPLALKAPNRSGELSTMMAGALSAYSNAGPSRLGDVIKPDVVAPGQYWTAAAALNTQAFISRDTSGRYQAFNGTSAATPYAAGVVALLFQKKPTLTVGELKSLLRDHADRDREVNRGGPAPNPEWGYGKLNRKAVLAMLEALR